MTENKKETISRRAFIKRLTKAGISMAAAVALGGLLFDPEGPSGKEEVDLASLPDFAIEDLKPRMGIASGSDRKEMVKKAVQSIGGAEKYIRNGDRVLIKVNAAFASPPILCATTHPDVVSALVNICLNAGAEEVVVTDNPINDPSSCFQLTGIRKAAEEAGGKIILPGENRFRNTTLKKGRLIKNWPLLYTPFEGINKIIGATPVKDHHRSGASMTMKNWYGLLGGRRNIFHQDIHNIIKELAMMVTPTFVILDGTQTMMTNGPTGGAMSDLKETNVMIASTDQVAADAFGAGLLERNISDLPFIRKAAEQGVGTYEYKNLNPERISIS